MGTTQVIRGLELSVPSHYCISGEGIEAKGWADKSMADDLIINACTISLPCTVKRTGLLNLLESWTHAGSWKVWCSMPCTRSRLRVLSFVISSITNCKAKAILWVLWAALVNKPNPEGVNGTHLCSWSIRRAGHSEPVLWDEVLLLRNLMLSISRLIESESSWTLTVSRVQTLCCSTLSPVFLATIVCCAVR